MTNDDDKGAYSRSTDPHTSADAAAHMNDSGKTSKVEGIVLACLKDWGAQTAEQVSIETGIDKQSVTPRFRSLADKGLIIDTGLRRENKSGRAAIVWRAV